MTTKNKTTAACLKKYYDKLEEAGKLTAGEWDSLNNLEKIYNREAYDERMEKGKREFHIEAAKKLSTLDLLDIIRERLEGIPNE